MTSSPEGAAPVRDTLIVAIVNQKGGVGKSTTTINLGAALAMQGERVLLVDLDPQGNTTSGLGIDRRSVDMSTYEILVDDVPVDDAMEPTSVRDLFLIPATIELAGAEIELVSMLSRENRLRNALKQIIGNFDFVLIDCPPSLGLLTINGLSAAVEVMHPDPVRVLRVGGSQPTRRQYSQGQEQSQSSVGNRGRRPDNVRRADQPRLGCCVPGACALRRHDVSHRDTSHRPAVGSTLVWRNR